jgi:hypothetical protein
LTNCIKGKDLNRVNAILDNFHQLKSYQWLKVESFSSRTRNKKTMPTLATSIQQSTGSSSQSNYRRERKKASKLEKK